jgi:hypothetical protein
MHLLVTMTGCPTVPSAVVNTSGTPLRMLTRSVIMNPPTARVLGTDHEPLATVASPVWVRAPVCRTVCCPRYSLSTIILPSALRVLK